MNTIKEHRHLHDAGESTESLTIEAFPTPFDVMPLNAGEIRLLDEISIQAIKELTEVNTHTISRRFSGMSLLPPAVYEENMRVVLRRFFRQFGWIAEIKEWRVDGSCLHWTVVLRELF